ncbi:MAG: c-type cytochrome [Chloroflexota bacterium]|nr:c-type cytochrome [Chloroflexota bacterium]
MTDQSQKRRLTGGLAVLLLLGGVLTSCGESRPVATSAQAVVAPSVPQITVPPGSTPVPRYVAPDPCREPVAMSPTPRVAELIANSATASSPVVDDEDPCPTSNVPLSGPAEAGRRQFTAMGCIACHGTDLSGGIGPELRNRTVEDLSEAHIREQARQGGSGMPAFPNLSEQELQNFIAFIRSQA